MCKLLWFCVSLLLSCSEAFGGTITVRECRGEQGERLFSDHGNCAPVRTLELVLPPPAPPPPPVSQARRNTESPRRSYSNRRARSPQADSYRCDAGGRSWYQHTPCSSANYASNGKGERGTSVRQSRVSRSQACQEIARPAALLRRGNERDERAGPYAKATGRDPCR